MLQPMAKLLLYLLYSFWFVAIAPPPPRRAPSTALSMRSKSMTSELEDLGKHSHDKQKHLIQCLVLLNVFIRERTVSHWLCSCILSWQLLLYILVSHIFFKSTSGFKLHLKIHCAQLCLVISKRIKHFLCERLLKCIFNLWHFLLLFYSHRSLWNELWCCFVFLHADLKVDNGMIQLFTKYFLWNVCTNCNVVFPLACVWLCYIYIYIYLRWRFVIIWPFCVSVFV